MSTNHHRKSLVFNEETSTYISKSVITKDEILDTALDILSAEVLHSEPLTNPALVSSFLVTKFAGLEHEVFSILLLDNRHRVLRYEELFRGTIDGCSVHPREVLKAVLHANAAALILAHNHPSGIPEPSKADISLTKRLTDALALIDVRVLDHLVVGSVDTVSFAERGLL
jgi:DNA repair protein RadC